MWLQSKSRLLIALLLIAAPSVAWIYRAYVAAAAASKLSAPSPYEWIAMAVGVVLLVSLAISEDWIAALARAKRAWGDANAPLRSQLQDFKNRFGALMSERLQRGISEEDFQSYKSRADALLTEAAEWVEAHVGPIARDQLLDRADKPSVSYSQAVHEKHNRLLMDLASIRRNLDAIKRELER